MHKGPPTLSVWILLTGLTLLTGTIPAAPWPSARVSHPASPETRSLLLRADRFVTRGEWEEGVNALRVAMDAHGDERIRIGHGSAQKRLPKEPQLFISVRQYCHLKLINWSVTAPAALAIYRQQVDPLVKQRLQTALANQERHGLAEIAHRFFASSHADEALWHLGEWALERGDYNRARWAWERLHPALRHRPGDPDKGLPFWLAVERKDPNTDTLSAPTVADSSPRHGWPLAYPDSNYPLAELRARLLLVSILEGSSQRAKTEYQWYQQVHSLADGSIAGRQGLLVDLLRDLLDRSHHWPTPAYRQGWSTFAGNQARSLAIPQAVDLELRAMWTVQIASDSLPRRVAIEPQPPYFPVVVEDHVILHDAQRIQAFNLQTGHAAFPGEFPTDNEDSKAVSSVLYEQEPFTVEKQAGKPLKRHYFAPTLYRHQVFTALGFATNPAQQPYPTPSAQSQLIGLDLKAEGRLLRGFPLTVPESGWTWDGPPVCDGSRLHVPLRKQTDTQSEVALARYDLATGQQQGLPVQIASSMHAKPAPSVNWPDNLLSLSNGYLLYNTNLGTIAAFDTEQDSLKWIFHYHRSARSERAAPRPAALLAPTPCLVHKDFAIVAPLDSERILALDVTTGQLIWSVQREAGMELLHLLGVAGDRVIASGKALYAFDLYSGQLRARFPSAPETTVHGYGRGLLAGNQVYWPTGRVLFFLDANSLSPVRQPVHLERLGIQGGNLVLAGETLLITGPQRMSALRGLPLRAVPAPAPAAHRALPLRQTSINRF